MNGETQDGPERDSRGAVWVWLCWLGAIVLLYVLSTGPVIMMASKVVIRQGPVIRVLIVVYWPVVWAYEETPLHRPIGIYWHLWAPDICDSKGNLR
jgi:hypothetical protein